MFYGEIRIDRSPSKAHRYQDFFQNIHTTYYQLSQEISHPFVESSALSIDYYFPRNNLYIILFRKINQKNLYIQKPENLKIRIILTKDRNKLIS